MDRLTSMTIFVSVVDLGSFTAAARAHALSATMVAKHVNALEARLDTRLLHRTTRRLSPTEAGRRFAESCRRVLADVAVAEAVGAEVARTPVGRLRIAAPVAFGSERVAPLLATYLDRFPDMQAELVLGDRKVDLIEEGFDLAFRIGALEDDWLVAHPLAPYRLMLAAAPSYLARHGHPETPADLREHRLIGFAQFGADECWTLIGRDGEHVVPLPSPRLRINHAAALRQAAIAGYGIILQSSVTLDGDLASGRLVPVLPDYAPEQRPLTLVRLPDRRMTAGLRAFVDMAVSAFGDGGRPASATV
ncbi:LysR family transcriptional regulator [Sphingomonas sp. SORGH_AS_0879]|uniref:LysR family transcriptional regulator n=1 Tax=Sphingomonas sp. SORGH_AS_0879 TaxID=3041790 RepID=UPI0027844926|nr:LysR family transcriptional regulator [Sphingomonas sp. SORGH_AS_0879]MDQ1231564.1 DNA-binding transcriptional LysR family regulator [Sphingomonas sp. SORGH_AS_0879]